MKYRSQRSKVSLSVISKTMAPQGIGSALRPIAFVFWEINKRKLKITRRRQWAAQEETRLRSERQAHLLSLGQGQHALRRGQFFLQ